MVFIIMKKHHIIFLRCTCSVLIAFFVSFSRGNSHAESAPFTLEEALRMASDTADEARLIELRYEKGIHEKNEYRSAAFPYITMEATAGPTRQSLETQNQSMPDFSFGGGQSTGGQSGIPSDPLNNREDTIRALAREEALALDSAMLSAFGGGISFPDEQTGQSVRWTVTAAQPLITFGKVSSALKAARLRDTMLTDVRRYELDTLYAGIIDAYAHAYTAQREVAVAEKALSSAARTLQRMEIEYENGAIPRRHVLLARAGHARAEADLLSAHSQKSASYKSLAERIGIYPDTTFILTAPSENFASVTHAPTDATDGLGYIIQRHWLNLQENQVKYERSKLFPSINLFGNVSNNLLYTDDSNSPDAGAIFDPDYISYTVGFQLSWTIFDGLRTPSVYRKTRVQKKISEINLQRSEKQLVIAIDRLKSNLVSLEKTRDAVTLQRDAAREAYEFTEKDFQAGAADITTLLESEKEWLAAENRYNRIYVNTIALATQLKLLLGRPIYKDGT
ncbi:MAG: hypothetical protein GF350_11020 [Chitinivibrionales bacterium]|nr:hypothetical protein [Chitinivibrionales bacterium]